MAYPRKLASRRQQTLYTSCTRAGIYDDNNILRILREWVYIHPVAHNVGGLCGVNG